MRIIAEIPKDIKCDFCNQTEATLFLIDDSNPFWYIDIIYMNLCSEHRKKFVKLNKAEKTLVVRGKMVL